MSRFSAFSPYAAALAGLAFLAGAPCSYGAATESPIAKAADIELSATDIRRLIDALPEATRRTLAATPGALAQAVRGELLRRLVLEEARAKGFDKDAAVSAELDKLREEIVLRQWVARAAKLPAGYPSEDELQRGYQALRERVGGTSDYHLAQIFISLPDGATPERAQAALRKAGEVQSKLGGGDFAALAKAYSEHAESAAKGGDLGLLPESQVLPEVRAALGTMKVGDTAGPVKTAQGLHFVRLLEKKPAVLPPLGEVREALIAALRQAKASELQQAYLSDLTKRSPPTLNELELAKLLPKAP